MPRLRNELTGAVMTVSDETAANLGSEWSEAKAESEDKPARRTSK